MCSTNSICLSLSLSVHFPKSFLCSLSFFILWFLVISSAVTSGKKHIALKFRNTHTLPQQHLMNGCAAPAPPLLTFVLVSSAALEILPRIPPCTLFSSVWAKPDALTALHLMMFVMHAGYFWAAVSSLRSWSCRAACFVALKGEMFLKSFLNAILIPMKMLLRSLFTCSWWHTNWMTSSMQWV